MKNGIGVNAWYGIGNPVIDMHRSTADFWQDGAGVGFASGGEVYHIPYQGAKVCAGGKYTAALPLDGFRDLPGTEVIPGGGVTNTISHLGQRARDLHLPVELKAVDLAKPDPVIDAQYRDLGIDHLTPGVEPMRANLVLACYAEGNRMVFRSPFVAPEVSADVVRDLCQPIAEDAQVLLINSPASTSLTQAASDGGLAAGADQCSVLTPSLPLEVQFDLLLARDRFSVCNLIEFGRIAGDLDIDCPSDEAACNPEDLAHALEEVSRACQTGSLVVTLGGRGCVALDRETGQISHIGLREEPYAAMHAATAAAPQKVNGVGDRFFGDLILAYAWFGLDFVGAVLFASHQAACQIAPELKPETGWFSVRALRATEEVV